MHVIVFTSYDNLIQMNEDAICDWSYSVTNSIFVLDMMNELMTVVFVLFTGKEE